jgi:hypothetical protein
LILFLIIIQLEKNCYFFRDITNIIILLEKFFNYHEVFSFLRPPRFGKTLLISILECYFDINLKEYFEFFFKKTIISNYDFGNFKFLPNKLLIFKISFLSMTIKTDNEDKIQKIFQLYFYEAINKFILKYCHLIPSLKSISFKGSLFMEPLEKMYSNVENSNYRLCILIDEYDKPLNSFINKNFPKIS